MKKLSLFIALFALVFAFVAAPVFAEGDEEAGASPADVVKTMLEAWKAGDVDTVIACMDASESDPEAAEGMKTYIGLMLKSIMIEDYKIGETTIEPDDENTAEVALTITGSTDVEAYKAGYWAMMGMNRDEYCKMLMGYGMTQEDAEAACDEIDSGAEESLEAMAGDMFNEKGTTAWLTLTSSGWKIVQLGADGTSDDEEGGDEDGDDGMDD